jgi:hypothetical protein
MTEQPNLLPDGYDWLRDDDGKPVYREPKGGEYFFVHSIGESSASAVQGNLAHRRPRYILVKIKKIKPATVDLPDVPRDLVEFAAKNWNKMISLRQASRRFGDICRRALESEKTDGRSRKTGVNTGRLRPRPGVGRRGA